MQKPNPLFCGNKKLQFSSKNSSYEKTIKQKRKLINNNGMAIFHQILFFYYVIFLSLGKIIDFPLLFIFNFSIYQNKKK